VDLFDTGNAMARMATFARPIACASSMMQPLSSENAWWSTLAQEHRLKVFRTLVQAGPSSIPTGAIATGG